MLRGLRRYLGILLARRRFRTSPEKVISFCGALSSAKHVLLLMPFGRREFLPTIMMIDLLKRQFQEDNITVVSSDHGLEAMRMLPRSTFIHVLSSEINPLFLPRSGVLQRIMKKKYDIAIDLNLDLELPPAYICKASGARVRVGFNKKYSDMFYNLQIQRDLSSDRSHVYDRLVRCLQMF
jgi:ADP-heptose:LPS heptosyltransferase